MELKAIVKIFDQHIIQQGTAMLIASLRQFSVLGLFLAFLRLLPAALITVYVIFMQEYVYPLIFFPPLRRYLSCMNNLIWIRLALYILGVSKLNSQNYKFFKSRDTRNFYSYKNYIKFASGWVGVASYTNILDFLYFSCHFSPTFVRMVLYYEENDKKKLLYEPLGFWEAFSAAWTGRGFDPVVLKGRHQFARYKGRKLAMQFLIQQSFQQLNGPILVFLPQTRVGHMLTICKDLYKEIVSNGSKFTRQGVAFYSYISSNPQSQSNIKKIKNAEASLPISPTTLLLHLCSKFRSFELVIENMMVSLDPYELYKINSKAQMDNPVNKYYQDKGFNMSCNSIRQFLSDVQKIEIKAAQQQKQEDGKEKQKKKKRAKKFKRSCH